MTKLYAICVERIRCSTGLSRTSVTTYSNKARLNVLFVGSFPDPFERVERNKNKRKNR